jgi:hypothetical protein
VARADAWLLEVIDGASLELVDDLVDAGLVAHGRRMRPERAAVDDEGHLHDV